MLNVVISLDNPRVLLYKFANLGSIPLLIHSVEIQVRTDNEILNHRLEALKGRVMPPIRANEVPHAGKFEIEDKYWKDGLAALGRDDLGPRVTTEAVVSDVGQILTFKCIFNALTGYRVEQLHSPKNIV
jgi:hypothetical protein